MATINTNRLETLPLELLEIIIEQLPVPDVLRIGQANRGFHDLIHRSLRIQHKLDLYGAGLEPNWSTNFSLADRVKALEEYRSGWQNVNIGIYQAMVGPPTLGSRTAVAGVYGIPAENEIKFCTLPSSLRAIEPKSHTIQFGPGAVGFAFNPHADVIVVAVPLGSASSTLELHLITMSEGVPHPCALKKTIESTMGSARVGASLSITCHRLALMVRNRSARIFPLYVWDWRTGELLFEDSSPSYWRFEFLDDYRLATMSWRNGSSELLLLDTKLPMGPTQTLFHGPVSPRRWVCLFETGGYKPSPQDLLTAPFYPDPSQRILALSVEPQGGFYVVKVETLLRIARERAGEAIQWEEWKPSLIETAQGTHSRTYCREHWVSGFRLFSTSRMLSEGRNLRVHDFSPHASMKFLHLADDGRKLMHPSIAAFRLLQYNSFTRGISFGHDSMVVEFHRWASARVHNLVPDIGKL